MDNITEKDFYYLLVNIDDEKTNYKIIKDKITSSDPEDGGADHDLIIQNKNSNKFYYVHYTDWDVDYNFDFDEDTGECSCCDIELELKEVFPKKKTFIVYE